MIVVRVELHSAVTGKVTELARMLICNVSGAGGLRDYFVETLRGRSKDSLDKRIRQRYGNVKGHASESLHVWHLVAKALREMKYG